jgi:hypothetical protein
VEGFEVRSAKKNSRLARQAKKQHNKQQSKTVGEAVLTRVGTLTGAKSTGGGEGGSIASGKKKKVRATKKKKENMDAVRETHAPAQRAVDVEVDAIRPPQSRTQGCSFRCDSLVNSAKALEKCTLIGGRGCRNHYHYHCAAAYHQATTDESKGSSSSSAAIRGCRRCMDKLVRK